MDTLFIGYAASLHGSPGWRLAFRQSTPIRQGGVVRRTVWQDERDPNRRLIFDASEYFTPANADRALAGGTREEDGARYKPGTGSLGSRSLVYPADKPWSIYATRANLLIWGLSHGRAKLEVEPMLKPVMGELDADRATDLDQHLTFSRETGPDAHGGVILSVQPQWQLGEWAWMKFVATGGSLERHREPNRIVVHPTAPATATVVTGWVVEPGKKPYMGRYSLA